MHFSLGVIFNKDDVKKSGRSLESLLDEVMEPYREHTEVIDTDEMDLDTVIEDIVNKIIRLKDNKKWVSLDDLFEYNDGLYDIIGSLYDVEPENIEIDYEKEIVTIDITDYIGYYDWFCYGKDSRWNYIPLKDGAKHYLSNNKTYAARVGDISFEKDDNTIKAIKDMFNEKEVLDRILYQSESVDEAIEKNSGFITYSILDAHKGIWFEYIGNNSEDYEKYIKENFNEDDIFVLVDCHV